MPQSNTVRLGPQGRVVIPAPLRQALGLQPGDELIARVDEGRLVLETREHIWARVRADFRAAVPPRTDLVKELHADRRAEFLREQAEMAKEGKRSPRRRGAA